MSKFGLIGTNIQQSLSPELFKVAYDNKHKYDLIDESDFSVAWRKFTENYKAVNITAPFKQTALQQFAKSPLSRHYDIEQSCIQAQASNLIIKNEAFSSIHNTDVSGVIMSIAESLFPGINLEFHELFPMPHKQILQFCSKQLNSIYTQKPQALIIGCGGAGKAAAIAAYAMGYDVAILNRTQKTAEAFCQYHKDKKFIPIPFSNFKQAFKECELIIYTLPVSIPELDSLDIEDFSQYSISDKQQGKIILEAQYVNPAFRPQHLIKLISAGANYINGTNWLLNQACVGFQLMTGDKANRRKMLELLSKT